MPTADLLDFNALTAPIAGDDPAGSSGDFYTVRRLLDDCRTSHDPDQFPAGTPEREQERRDPNWQKIISESKTQLQNKCKHMLYAVRMCEGLVMQNGFAGVRDGLKLVKLLFTDCWERVFPKIEEAGDEAARVAQVNWLGDPVSGAFYPTKIRKTPMFGAFSWQSWKDTAGDFEAAVSSTPIDKLKITIEDLEGAQQELRELLAAVEAKVSDEPAELGEVTRALNDCVNLAKQAFAKKGGDEAAAAAAGVMGEAGGVAVEGGVAGSAGSGVLTRDGIYESIKRLAEALQKIEPHSPVPMYLLKAIQLGPMNFPKLVETLTKDRNVLDYITAQDEET